MQHHVFLSYSRKDAPIMQRVRGDLQAGGLRVWTDEGIEPGSESWKMSIETALRGSACLIAILSPDAANSRWVREELDFAEAHHKKVFLILARGEQDDAVPFGYSTHQWIDIRSESNHPIHMRQLIQAVREHAEGENSVISIPTSHTAGGYTPSSTIENPHLDPNNLFNHLRLVFWLFLQPAQIAPYQRDDSNRPLRQTTAWAVSALAFLPFLLPAAGYALGIIQTPDAPRLPSLSLIVAGLGFVVEYLITGWLGWRMRQTTGTFLTVIIVILTIGIYLVLPNMSNVIFARAGWLPGFLFMLTTAISLGVGFGIAFQFANNASAALIGVVVAAIINSVISKLQLGIQAGVAGGLMVLLAIMVSAALQENIRTGKAAWYSVALFVVLTANYGLMLWLYLLGGWSVLAAT
jgi:hypothetical protein